MPKYTIPARMTIYAKDDADAHAKVRKLDALLVKHGRALLLVEGITLDKVVLDPKITKEPT